MHKTQDLPRPPKSDDDEEPLGTVCECCWKNIPDPDDVWYAEDGTAMCEDCFRYHEGDVCAEEHRDDDEDDFRSRRDTYIIRNDVFRITSQSSIDGIRRFT